MFERVSLVSRQVNPGAVLGAVVVSWTLVSLAVAGLAAATAASAAWPTCRPWSSPATRYDLHLRICGPTKVIPNRDYDYSVVVTNLGRSVEYSSGTFGPTHRGITISVVHYDPLTRSSIRFRPGPEINPTMRTSVVTLKQLKRRQSFRFGITLPFRRHADPTGSNFVVFVRSLRPNETQDATEDVVYR